MKQHGRLDRNHNEIVKTLRQVGASVQSLADVGRGCPDIVVGYGGNNFLIECKDGSKSESQRRLTQDEIEWHTKWRGKVFTVLSSQEALKVIGVE